MKQDSNNHNGSSKQGSKTSRPVVDNTVE